MTMNKRLFNFYLDEDLKASAINKLERICGIKSKGQLASYLRVCIQNLVNTPDEEVSKKLVGQIDAEYLYSQVKNKRSSL